MINTDHIITFLIIVLFFLGVKSCIEDYPNSQYYPFVEKIVDKNGSIYVIRKDSLNNTVLINLDYYFEFDHPYRYEKYDPHLCTNERDTVFYYPKSSEYIPKKDNRPLSKWY